MSKKEKANILIVDDEMRVREILSRKLTDDGFNCVTAADGNTALKMLKADSVELVLLDIMMPGKAGPEVLREIKAKYPDTAVIMVTAIADVQTAIGLMRMGAYDYIIKPVELNVLTVSLDRALEKRKLVIENRDYQQHLEQRVEEQTKKIRQSFLNSTTSLAYALEAKDKYTHGHSERVTEIAVAVAREMDAPKYIAEKIKLAGLLHDVGKIGISEMILNKPGKLTDDEFELVKAHCEVGERILSPIIEDREILEMVRHHHERFDGRGYPDGLSGEQMTKGLDIIVVTDAYSRVLSQGAMALAVADAYDAMTSDRPYRPAMLPEEAYAELIRGRGKQFAPVIVDTFISLMNKGKKSVKFIPKFRRPETKEKAIPAKLK
ncbi:MAG TPA: HD domain-containing phosphohydrolase [Dehalococcoidia bacterium]|jgi:response regulator RpfG family c-di-GMP phosphodiesterase